MRCGHRGGRDRRRADRLAACQRWGKGRHPRSRTADGPCQRSRDGLRQPHRLPARIAESQSLWRPHRNRPTRRAITCKPGRICQQQLRALVGGTTWHWLGTAIRCTNDFAMQSTYGSGSTGLFPMTSGAVVSHRRANDRVAGKTTKTTARRAAALPQCRRFRSHAGRQAIRGSGRCTRCR